MIALERYLNSFGKSVVNKSKGILDRKKKVVTGALKDSIKFKLVKTSQGINVEFSMLDYGKFMDKGVSGVGGEIKSGKNKGNYSGIRDFVNYKGERMKSPYSYKSKMPPTRVLDI